MSSSDIADPKRPRAEDSDSAVPPAAKRSRESANDLAPSTSYTHLPNEAPPAVSRLGLKPLLPILPSSLKIVTGIEPDLSERKGFVGEQEVGIIGYLGDPTFSGVQGVIKQRFGDFMVNEISLSGEILHLKDISMPQEQQEQAAAPSVTPVDHTTDSTSTGQPGDTVDSAELPTELQFEDHPSWPSSATHMLRPHLSDDAIVALHGLLLEGKTPKPIQDAGWGSRVGRSSETPIPSEEEMAMNAQPDNAPSQGRSRGRGRPNRGGRGGGSRGQETWHPEDTREVLSQVIEAKEARAAAHKAIREALKGIFETSARDVSGQGQRLVIKWASSQPSRKANNARSAKLPQYIHFTLHKTNRETMDCLSHIGRMLNVHSKDLSVCGTKDKRAVTVQRVCLKRGNHTLEGAWRAVNGIKAGRRTEEEAIAERGERGTRIGDLSYSAKLLDLGKLKGNHFTITLRNIKESEVKRIDEAMQSIRDRGFLNFYGMQRFGTSTVPTHVTGLLLLQQKWSAAIDSVLSLREGEHPDCARGRLAWLEDKDFKKALELMPRRSVAERAIWEHWKKGNKVEDKLGALNSIPRNLRSMYVHAYQSYIWNLATAQRIKLSNTHALVGDLVYADQGDDDDDDTKHTAAVSREVKVLTELDVANYELTDVIMPLPGWHVDYPEGEIGQLYHDLLAADGLDPKKMRREQREYSLPGSYRKIVHKPTDVSWEHIRYTDPDLSFTQSDEDKLLNLNPPAGDDPNGKFHALKISWSLGTSSYATMALREITRQETASWHQIGLTLGGEDQAHKGVVASGEGDA